MPREPPTTDEVRARLRAGYQPFGKGYSRYARAANDVLALLKIIKGKDSTIDYLLQVLGREQARRAATDSEGWEGYADA